MVLIGSRLCSRCKEVELPLSRRHPYCSKCFGEYTREREQDPVKLAARRKANNDWNKRNRGKLAAARRRRDGSQKPLLPKPRSENKEDTIDQRSR